MVDVDISPPTLVSTDPPNGATGTDLSTVFRLVFYEPIRLGSVPITVARGTDPGINVTARFTPSVQGNALTLSAAGSLENNASYRFNVPEGSIVDLAGNSFAGFPGGYQITTVGITEPSTGGGGGGGGGGGRGWRGWWRRWWWW
jgi:hypothetical protein